MPLADTRDLVRLAKQRRALELLKVGLAHALRNQDATPEGQAVALALSAIRDIQTGIIESEATIRGTALEHYDGTGEREAWPGVKVKLYTVIKYVPKTALAWARENAPHLLMLNHDAFKRAAKARLTGTIGVVAKEPRAQIARDLSEYLPGPDQEEPEEDERDDLPI